MDRRREGRIEAGTLASRSAVFELALPDGPVPCRLENFSRQGLGVVLPPGAAGAFVDGIAEGAELSGALIITGEVVSAEVIVRARRGAFLGLEYIRQTPAFVTRMRALLTPSYIASSIAPLSPAHLASDIEAAWRGDDFECVVFRSGASSAGRMIQIYTQGRVLELGGKRARFVPPALVRRTMREDGSDLDYVTETASLEDDATSEEMKSLRARIARVVLHWKDCPPAVAQAFLPKVRKAES